MTDRRDITLIAPYVKLAAATFDELREADAKADAKLHEHDNAFGVVHSELLLLRNRMTIQIDAIAETLRRIKLGIMNGH